MDEQPEQSSLFSTADSRNTFHPFVLGYIIDGEYVSDAKYSIDSKVLQRNALICGAAGMGKSNACMYMLSTLWRKYQIPFLLFEAYTTLYRMPMLLSDCFRNRTKLFTLGNRSVSPLKLNVLEVPPGVDVHCHMEGLILILQASFKMKLSESNFLRHAFNLMYQQGSRPSLDDLDRCIANQSFGFSGKELESIRQRLLSIIADLRKGAKADLFSRQNTIPHKVLFSQPTVIELREAVSDAEKNFCMNVILFLLYQYCRTRSIKEDLQHLVVLDNAEKIINADAPYLNVNQKSTGLSAASLAATFIAQLRCLEEGFLYATNTPAALPPPVIDNCNLRIIFRLLGDLDFRSISGGAYLNNDHRRVISSLARGRAVVYRDGDILPYHLAIMCDQLLEVPPPETPSESDEVVKEIMADAKEGTRSRTKD